MQKTSEKCTNLPAYGPIPPGAAILTAGGAAFAKWNGITCPAAPDIIYYSGGTYHECGHEDAHTHAVYACLQCIQASKCTPGSTSHTKEDAKATPQSLQDDSAPHHNYLRNVVYVDTLNKYWPPHDVLACLNTPQFVAHQNAYSVVNLAFWLASTQQPADAAAVYAAPMHHISAAEGSVFKECQNDAQMRAVIKQYFHAHGRRLLVSAFGSTDVGLHTHDPEKVGDALAKHVLDNAYDGVDIDYEDNAAVESGVAEEWLIRLTRTLRKHLPSPQYTLTHAPQAPYFTGTHRYKNGAYIAVHAAVGDLIDWYNVQFYNQGQSAYDSYETLFTNNDACTHFPHTAVKQIHERARVPLEKIVIGKPATPQDACNTGYVHAHDLRAWGARAQKELGWHAGWMVWQFKNDQDGKFINEVCKQD